MLAYSIKVSLVTCIYRSRLVNFSSSICDYFLSKSLLYILGAQKNRLIEKKLSMDSMDLE